MQEVRIDGKEVDAGAHLNLIQAAEVAGIEIPHYCFHPGLSIPGNCRMCLVEVEKAPKLQIACNTRVAEGMVVHTRSPKAKAAQKAVLEFLLINHPIDCPVCDQAGECKLQDYYMDYDQQPSRFPLNEKNHKGKAIDIGSGLMLDQERCILCGRCTGFFDEKRQSFLELQHETRVTAPLVQAKDELVAETWGAAVSRAGAAIEDFKRQYGPRSIGAIIDAHSTNEEAFALKHLMKDVIGSDRIATLNWSPPGASGDDDLLIRANKNPNTRGLAALGLAADGIDSMAGAVSSGVLYVLVPFAARLFSSRREHQFLQRLRAPHSLFLSS